MKKLKGQRKKGLLAIDQLKKLILIRIRDGDQLISDLDPAPFDRFDFSEGYHIGFMDSAYDTGGNQLFKLTEILQGHDLFIDRVDPAVVAHTFNVDDFIEHDLLQPVFGLDEDEFRWRIRGATGYIVLRLINGLQEAVEVEGL